jgi:DNA mismatch repair protein MutS2
LKALKYQDERFENASVEFDDSTLQPTYRLLWGIPGRSNALTIAKRLGLNPEIVEEAQKRVGRNSSEDVNQVIAALEAQRREQETKAAEASKLLKQTERFYEEVSEKAAFLQTREKELKQSQEKAVQQAINAAKEQIAQVIRQLQQGKQTAQKAQKATEALNQIAERELSSTKSSKLAKPSYKPQVGEKVRIPSLGQTGEVLSLDEEQGQLTIRFGLMKMNVSLTEIESLAGEKVEVAPKAKSTSIPQSQSETAKPVTVRTSQNTIDLRGSRVVNAEVDLETAIASATQSGMLWIIHGKGTGRLREGVHEFLRRHPQVERFELAPQNEGGSGVTIVYLR